MAKSRHRRFAHSLFCVFSASICVAMLSSQGFAQGDSDLASPYKDRCSTGSMLEMTRCLDAELKKIEQRLKNTYERLHQSLRQPGSLEQAQQAWRRFRILECEFCVSGISKDASLYSFTKIACQIDLDLKRIGDLERYASWAGAAGTPLTK